MEKLEQKLIKLCAIVAAKQSEGQTDVNFTLNEVEKIMKDVKKIEQSAYNRGFQDGSKSKPHYDNL